MKLDIQAIADRMARRAGFKRATEIVADARRRYGAAVVKAVKGYRGPGSKWIATVCKVAVPALWFEDPVPPRLGKPTILRGVMIPTADQTRRLTRYRRLHRYNDHRTAYRIAFGVESDAEELMARFIADGILKVDQSRVKESTPRKPKPSQGWLPFWG
jgi:hypothetical protein